MYYVLNKKLLSVRGIYTWLVLCAPLRSKGHFEADLIVLDEPTVALSLKEVRKVLDFIRRIRDAGKSCIFITHTFPDVYEVSDRFVIMDRSELVGDIARRTPA